MNTSTTHASQIDSGQRFKFGKNWQSFLTTLSKDRIEHAKKSMLRMLGEVPLDGMRFLDAGSGSGLSSLVARQLGASVVSFDFDPLSVECTAELRNQYFPDDPKWEILEGSILDCEFLRSLGEFDIVYSWGVLHHTGQMWQAMDAVASQVKQGGRLFIMIYADNGWKSNVWRAIKRTYCSHWVGKSLVLGAFIPYYAMRGLIEDTLAFKHPWRRYSEYVSQRGMSRFHDWRDWLGGYPFEVANVDSIAPYLAHRGYRLETQVGQEYIFKRDA